MDTPQEERNVKSKKRSFLTKFRLTPKQKLIWKSLLIILVVCSVFGGVYGYAYNTGFNSGEKSAKKSNASEALKNIQNPFKSISGVVEKIDDNSLTMTTSKGEAKTIKLTDKTKITKKSETLSRDTLTKGTKITVFTQGTGGDITTTRIVVR